MANSDTSRFELSDITAALGLLTRLPVPVDGARAQARGAAAAWAYPVVGGAVGLITALIGGLALWLGLPPALAAGLMLGGSVLITGAMHEDGLADCADGFWGGWDRARRLEIMKDSRIGAYGVIALVLGLGLRWLGIAALLELDAVWTAALVPAITSRAAMAWVMAALPPARDTGLSQSVGRPAPTVAWSAVGLAAVATLVLAPGALIAIAVLAVVATLLVAALARAKIGGQTGDVLGATQQLTEIAVLCALAAQLAA